MLVVVAIIAVLVAMLLPAIAAAREQGRAIQCLANLHQFGPILMSYAADYNNHLPWRYWCPRYTWYWTWEIVFVDYGYMPADLKVNHCPSQLDSTKLMYAANAYLFGIDHGGPHPSPGVAYGVLNSIKIPPADAIVMCEKQHAYNDYNTWGPGAWEHTGCSWVHRSGKCFIPAVGGTGSCQFLFLDGHAKFMEDTGFFSPIWITTYIALHAKYWTVASTP